MSSNVGLVQVFRKVWEISVSRLSAILPDNPVNRLVSSDRLTSLVLDVTENRFSAFVDRTRTVTLNTTGRETPYFLLISGLKHGPWRPAAANK